MAEDMPARFGPKIGGREIGSDWPANERPDDYAESAQMGMKRGGASWKGHRGRGANIADGRITECSGVDPLSGSIFRRNRPDDYAESAQMGMKRGGASWKGDRGVARISPVVESLSAVVSIR